MKTFDLKSFIIGILICTVIFLSIGANNTKEENGRYQIAQANSYNKAMILDTKTGTVVTFDIHGKKFYEYLSGGKIREKLNQDE